MGRLNDGSWEDVGKEEEEEKGEREKGKWKEVVGKRR